MALGLGAAVLILSFVGCSQKEPITPVAPPPGGNDLFPGLSFGDDTSFDIVTWNIKTFPKGPSQRPHYLAKALSALDVDVAALQEIGDATAFQKVLNELDGYDGHLSSSASYDVNLAIIYKTSTVTNVSFEEIFTSDWNPFPRSPLVMHCDFQGTPLVIIDNHLKCCGDGTIDSSSHDDEEYRRQRACEMLAGYINDNLPNDRVIVLGDFNDSLTDPVQNNVFEAFLDDSTHFTFSDMAIAEGPSTGWSWIFSSSYGPSHFDHILITDELFGAFAKSSTDVETLRPDKALSGGRSEYTQYLSDHLPVGMRIAF
jgi:endonuclease/exonuclease/phosphatase family metal-dependent hydrolase